MDQLLNIGASFDWMTPAWAIWQYFLNRPVAHFGVMAGAGFDRGDIRWVLKKRGVKSWGYVYNVAGDLIMFSVPKAKANWANYLLQSEGVPILYAPQIEAGEVIG